MYTKGKLGYLRSKKKHTESLFLTTDAYENKDMFIGKVYGFGIHDEKANAERMVLCWNLHDELVEALERALFFIPIMANRPGGCDPDPNCLHFKLKQVLDKAKG